MKQLSNKELLLHKTTVNIAYCLNARTQCIIQKTTVVKRKDRRKGVCERVNLPGCIPLSLALSSPIKPATLQQYGAINYRLAAISAKHAGEERQEHINRTNGHIKDQQRYKKPQTPLPH